MMRRYLSAVLMCAVLMLIMTFSAYADVRYEIETTMDGATITWWADGGADEYRYMKGKADKGAWGSAMYAGEGDSASIVVDGNGNYTVMAKSGDTVLSANVTVAAVDKTAPEIYVTGVEDAGDGTLNVYYDVDDYYGVAEIRMLKGSCSKADYAKGCVISGGVINGVEPGNYTIMAKDTSGNISVYPFSAGRESRTEKSATAETWESREEESWMYSGSSIEVHPLSDPKETPAEKPTVAPMEKLPQTGGTEPLSVLLMIAVIFAVVGIAGCVVLRRKTGKK